MKLISSISAITAGLIFHGEQSVADASRLAAGLGPVALLGVASSMAVLKLTSAAPCIEEDYDYMGNDLASAKDVSASDCSKRCRRTDGCKFWTYDPDHICWLKSSSKGRKSRKGWTSGDLSCPWHRCLREGVQLIGDSLRTVNTDSAVECQQECEAEPECAAFTRPVSGPTNRCSLMKDPRNQNPHNYNYISGLSNCEMADCLQKDHAIEGTPLREPIELPNLNACAEHCKTTDFCAAGSYTPSSKQCLLYDSFKLVAKADTHSFNYLDCERPTCSSLGVNFQGSDMESVSVSSPMECQQKCKEHPRCKAYTFHVYQKKCYLKPKTKAPIFVPDHVAGLGDCDDISSNPCLENDKDYVNTDISSVKVSSLDECAKKCREHENCILFTFNKKSFYCYLKAPGATKVERHFEGVRGDVSCAADPCVEFGVSYSGDRIGGDWPAATPKECQRLCKSKWDCNFYTFSYPNICKMFKNKAGAQDKSFNEVSGPRHCY